MAPPWRLEPEAAGAPPAPTPAQPPWRFSAGVGEKADELLLEALPYANQADVRRYRAALKEIEDPKARKQVRASGDLLEKEIRQLRGEAPKRASAAKKRGDPETAAAIRAASKSAQRGEEPEGPVETLKSGGRAVFKVLDAPHHLVRQVTTKAFGDSEHGLYDRDISVEEWAENIRKTSRAGGWKGALATAVRAAPAALGVAAGVPIGAVTAGVGALSDVPGVLRGEKTGEDVWRNVKETVAETMKDVETVGMAAETDPLSLISVGAAGAAKNAGATALRTALKAGLTRAQAESFAQHVAGIVAREGGTPAAAQSVRRALSVNPTLEQVAKEAWGEGLELLGRGQLELHPPFMSNRGVQPIPKLTGVEYPAAKAAKAVADPLLARAGRRPLFDPAMKQIAGMQRGARASVALKEIAANEELERAMAALPAGNRIGEKAIREEIRRRFQEPGFDLIPQGQPTPRPAVKIVDTPRGAMQVVPHADWVPASSQLDALFGPGAGQYADALRAWHMRRAQELLQSGALEPGQLAFNPVSEQYMQRLYTPDFGAFEDIVEAQLRPRPATAGQLTQPRVQQGLLSPERMEQLGVAKGEKDPFKILPKYSRQAALAQGYKDLERQVVDAFGEVPGVAAGSKLNVRRVLMEEYGKEIPADVHNALRGTFDRSLDSLAKIARRSPLQSTPAGRGIIAVLEGYSKLVGRFKGLVLKTPAYHAVNLMDDLVKMSADGMHNPAKYLSRAGKLVRGAAVDTPLGPVTLADANRHNLGLGAAARFERQGTEATTGRLRLAAEQASGDRTLGSRARELAPKVTLDDASQFIGDQWENRAKLAHWLWRIDAGDSPAIAAQRAMEVLIDYGDRSKWQQMAGWFVPFVKFAAESPKVTARLAVRNPGALNALDRFVSSAGGEGHEPRRYVSERGRHVTATPRGHEVAGNLREALGGAPAKQGLSTTLLPRLSVFESFQPLAELAQGNIDPAVLMSGPLTKAAVEYATEQDLLTKQPLERASLTGLLPAGVGPTSLQAAAGQNPWASRYLPPFLTNPAVLQALNQFAFNRGREGAPVAVLGGYRPYSARQDPQDIYAMQWLKWLTGMPTYETTPADRLWNLTHTPEFEQALRTSQAARTQEKLERAR